MKALTMDYPLTLSAIVRRAEAIFGHKHVTSRLPDKSIRSVTAEELIKFIEPDFAKWWLPDAVAFVDQIPRTSAGKFRKSELRERFRTQYATPS